MQPTPDIFCEENTVSRYTVVLKDLLGVVVLILIPTLTFLTASPTEIPLMYSRWDKINAAFLKLLLVSSKYGTPQVGLEDSVGTVG